MTVESPVATPWASRCLDGAVLVTGLGIAAAAAATVMDAGPRISAFYLFSIPVIMVIARFPLLLDQGSQAVEVGFDSSVLMFLLCTVPIPEALLLWSGGVVLTQLVTQKRAASKRFNIGVGILGGGVAALVLGLVRDSHGTPLELLAVLLAATCYFATDFLVSALSVSLETRTPFLPQLMEPGTAIAVACFVPFDTLGYLGAVVVRSANWWSLSLLAVPLVTLMIATRALTRGRENARRLEVLFDLAVRTQSLSDAGRVEDNLLEHARALLRLRQVEMRDAPPREGAEIGAPLQDGSSARWIVAPSRQRARSTVAGDLAALQAMAAVSSDALSRLRMTQDITHLAHHDVLTDLPNRGLVLDRVKHALELARRRGTRIAVLFCDLDGFKPVNDRFGHAAGDGVLVDVAARLASCVRESDTVARLGGDEFAILLENVTGDHADVTCQRILASLGAGVEVAGHHLPLSVSIGVALGETGTSAEHLLRNADMAMYQAKALGKGQSVHYQASLGRSRVQRLELVEALRGAVVTGALTLVYQPVIAVSTGRIAGVEALARWTSNGLNIPPDVFIGAAEESGLIVALGDLVLEMAADDAPQLLSASGGPLSMGVNISPQQLREPSFAATVERTAARMPGVQLVLEITERDCVSNDATSIATMKRLADHGIPFAIDDFGVGFSSIGYLQDLPIRIIKADASFSAGIDQDERSCGLLRSITMMGQALGLDVVVEGIERTTQLDHLRDHVRAPYAQGFLMHRPMPLAEVVSALEADRRTHDGLAAATFVA